MVAGSPGEVTSAFTGVENPSYTLGLVIPSGFDASLLRGEHPQVTLYFNGNPAAFMLSVIFLLHRQTRVTAAV